MIQAEHVPRKPGRPRKDALAEHGVTPISYDVVIDCAYEMSDSVRLEDLSLGKIARALNVSATTIRHHVKTRRALTAALIDRYFSDLRENLLPLVGDWKVDLDNYLWTFMTVNLRKRGFASYVFEHRFSPQLALFSSDSGQEVHTRFLGILDSAGLNPTNAAMAWHLIIHLLLSIAYAEARGLTPVDHVPVIDAMSQDLRAGMPGRATLAALRHISLPMIYGVITNMLTHAIEVKFDFPEITTSASTLPAFHSRNNQ
jgi:AcrR family transcriptional regulator